MDKSADVIIDYAKKFLDDKNNDIRSAAAYLMVIISN
jgi:hypothetical protein